MRTLTVRAVSMGVGASLVAGAAAVIGAGAAYPQAARGPLSRAPAEAAETYRVYVANESSDVISRVVFRPGEGLEVEREINVGVMLGDIDGPHGIAVSPSGDAWYVTIAHGTPFGTVWKFDAGPDTLVSRTELGLFPATVATTRDGQFLFIVNFNLHGDMVPSSVSIVHTPTMMELARPTTCVMPHGSRIDDAGARHYSACMMDDQLVEIDTRTFEVRSRFSVAPGREGPVNAADPHAGHAMGGGAGGASGAVASGAAAAVCSPTWAQPGHGAAARFVYVACNRNAEVLEVDIAAGRVTRRFATGRGPYNLEVDPAGRLLLATLKGDGAVQVFDLRTGESVARIATTRPVTHGVVISGDGRYAFVTNEAVGGTPGTLDVIDLERLERVASAELRLQPGGLGLWSGRP